MISDTLLLAGGNANRDSGWKSFNHDFFCEHKDKIGEFEKFLLSEELGSQKRGTFRIRP